MILTKKGHKVVEREDVEGRARGEGEGERDRKRRKKKGQRGGSVAKSTSCAFRGSEFDAWHPGWAAYSTL